MTEFYDKQNVLFVDLLNQVAKYDVEHALPTQQLIVNQTELEHHIENEIEDKNKENNVAETTEDLSNDDHADDASDNKDNSNDDKHAVDLSKDNVKTEEKGSQQTTKPAESKKDNALKALRNKSRMLKKIKFKYAKRKSGFSIWNQP